jgi:hypothetical protein
MQRLVPFNGPTKDYGLQDILKGYITNSAIEDWKFYDVFEGVYPRKRQALAVVLLVILLIYYYDKSDSDYIYCRLKDNQLSQIA